MERKIKRKGGYLRSLQVSRQTRCLYLGWLLRVQETDELDQLSPSLITNLIWAIWIKNVDEHMEQGIKMRAECLRSVPEEVEEGTKDGAVLDVVLFQRKGRHKNRKNLVERHSGIVTVDKSCNSACCVVLGIQPGAM